MGRLALFLMGAIFAQLCAAAGLSVRLSVVPTPSGYIDTRYRDGNDGTAAIPLTWQQIAPISVSTGASGSINLRALYLTEAGAPLATLTVACTPSLGGGFTATSDGLSWSATTAYSGVCVETATRSGASAASGQFSLTVTAPQPSDTTPPTVPTNLQVAAATNALSVSFDPSSDPYASGAGSGVTSYDICQNGTGCISVAAQKGLSVPITLTNLGSLSPTPTCTQSGADFTMVGAGSIDGASSLAGTCGGNVTSGGTGATPTFASVTVNSITNTADFAKCGLMVADSSAANSRAISAYAMAANGATFVEVLVRPTDGATPARASIAQVAGLPVTIEILKPADSTFTVLYSVQGGPFTAANTNYSLPIGTTNPWGMVGTATTGSGGATATCGLKNFNLNTGSRVSVNYPTSASGPITVRAHDAAGNSSGFTAGVSGTPNAPADTTPPTRTVQPSGAAVSDTSIAWSLGAGTDTSGIRGCIPYTKTSSGGTRTAQPEQATCAYTQTGLTASTNYCLDSKLVDNAGNLEASFSSEVCITTSASGTTDPTAAPVTSSLSSTGTPSPTTTLRAVHTLVANADHYKVRTKWCEAGSYWLSPFDHTGTTVDITGLNPGQCYDVEIGSANKTESVIIWQATSTEAAPASSGGGGGSAGAIKWHPGVYVWTSGTQGCDSATTSADFAVLDSISADTQIQGIELKIWWDCLEGNTEGSYAAGFALIDSYLAKLASLAVPKRLLLNVESEEYFSGSGCPNDDHAPNYLASQGLTVHCSSTSRWSVALWNVNGMQKMINLSNAYAARYDGNPLFEMFTPIEQTALAINGNGYSDSAWSTQLKRFYASAKTAWTHTLLRDPANYLGADSDIRGLIDASRGQGVITGGPDNVPDADRVINGNFVFRGCSTPSSGSSCTPGSSMSDLRSTEPWIAEVESPDYDGGGFCPGCSLSTLAGYASGSMHNSYIIWYRNTWQPPTSAEWPALLTFIRAGSSAPFSTACPSSFTGGCNTH